MHLSGMNSTKGGVSDRVGVPWLEAVLVSVHNQFLWFINKDEDLLLEIMLIKNISKSTPIRCWSWFIFFDTIAKLYWSFFTLWINSLCCFHKHQDISWELILFLSHSMHKWIFSNHSLFYSRFLFTGGIFQSKHLDYKVKWCDAMVKSYVK